MIALSSTTAAAIALHAAEGSWVMFVQTLPQGTAGPIQINGIEGRALAHRLNTITRENAYEVYLVGLIPSESPSQDAQAYAQEFAAYQIHDWWFEPHPDITTLIAQEAQESLTLILSEVRPGGLSDAPVDTEEMARILRVSVPTLRRMVKAGEIPVMRFGRLFRFVPADVLASLKR